MRCEQIRALIPEYLDSSLERGEMLQIQAHTSTCKGCYAEMESMSAICAGLDAWADEEPSTNLSRNFYNMLESYQQGMSASNTAQVKKKTWWHRLLSPAGFLPQLAMGALLLIVGFYLGGQKTSRTLPPELITQENTSPRVTGSMAVSLLNHQSASERLNGVNLSYELDEIDPKVLETMLHIVRADSNVNVRLAAVNALYAYRDQPKVRLGLVHALPGQESPMVQIALIDCLVAMGEQSATPELEELLAYQNLNPSVAEKARIGLSKLQ